MDCLSNPSFCKIMLPSMFAGGFWMEATQGLPAHMPKGEIASKHPFLLVRPEGAGITREEAPASSLAPVDPADAWPVVWLVRKGDGKISGGGFSGGWRGCAIDLKLAVGDAVVFEVLPGRREGLLALQMRVHRARDPDSIRPASEVLAELMKREEKKEEEEAGGKAAEKVQKDKDKDDEESTGYTMRKQHDDDTAVFSYSKTAVNARGGKKRSRTQSEAERLLMDAGGGAAAIVESGGGAGAAGGEEEMEEEEEEEAAAKKKGKSSMKTKKGQSTKSASAPEGRRKRVGDALLGGKVEKDFDGEMYAGVVASFDPAVNWYLVEYEDGDKEELTLNELRLILV